VQAEILLTGLARQIAGKHPSLAYTLLFTARYDLAVTVKRFAKRLNEIQVCKSGVQYRADLLRLPNGGRRLGAGESVDFQQGI